MWHNETIMSNFIVCLLDHNIEFRTQLCQLLRSKSFSTQCFDRSSSFWNYICRNKADCLITEITLIDGSGIKLLNQLAKKNIQLPAFILTNHCDIPTAVKAIKANALDVLEKKTDLYALVIKLKRLRNNQPS